MAISKGFINFLLIGMVITGSLNTLVYKYQNTTVVDGVRFNHPYMQALCMFVGEALCILLYFNKKRGNQQVEETPLQLQSQNQPQKKSEKEAIFILLIPAMFDLITSSLQHIALNFIPSSVYQMLRGGVIVVTAFYSKIFLGRTFRKFQLIGIAFTIAGVAVVGLSNFIFSSTKSEFSPTIQIISIILVIISLFSQGAIYVSEEKILKSYKIDTFFLVGVEGIWGLLAFAVIMPILNFIPCTWDEGCVPHDGHGYWERTDEFFIQALSDPWLGFAILLGIFSISLYNLMGVNVTKYISAVARTVVDVGRFNFNNKIKVRTVVIWIVGLLVTEFTNRKWENMSWQANLCELAGYVLLVFGNLVYNKMIVIEAFNRLDQEDQEKSVENISNLTETEE